MEEASHDHKRGGSRVLFALASIVIIIGGLKAAAPLLVQRSNVAVSPVATTAEASPRSSLRSVMSDWMKTTLRSPPARNNLASRVSAHLLSLCACGAAADHACRPVWLLLLCLASVTVAPPTASSDLRAESTCRSVMTPGQEMKLPLPPAPLGHVLLKG